MSTITTKVIKPHMDQSGRVVQAGQSVDIDENRYRQLARKGYVEKIGGVADEGDVDEGSDTAAAEGLTSRSIKSHRKTILKSETSGETPAQS